MNLLMDRLFSVALDDDPSFRCSLPELYVLAKKDLILDWTALRPHQYPAWHMFLAQLAVLAHRAVETDALHDADEWLAALRALTPDYPQDEPWSLVVDDWSLPAFLQPPVPPGAEADYRASIEFADSLDMLITSKNHDLKSDRMSQATSEQWLYALISLQTTEGYQGSGKYGIVRMNGGYKSRSMLRCYQAGLGVGGQVMRDVRVLLGDYEKWRERTEFGRHPATQPLLWLLPWDGMSSIPLDRFHPLAIEVCRRVRLRKKGEELFAIGAGSTGTRVAADTAKGNVGCPWAPIHIEEGKSFSLSGNGLGYRQMVDLLDPKKYTLPWLARPREADAEGGRALVMVAAGIARGQGKTEGVHERRVLLSAKTRQKLLRPTEDGESEFARRSKTFVEMAGNVAGKALRPALIQRVQAKQEPNWKEPATIAMIEPWTKRFNEEVDRRFFHELDRSFELDEDERTAEHRWSRVLRSTAEQVFDHANLALPVRSESQFFAEAWALGRLRAGLFRQLPSLLDKTEETEHETA